MVKKYIVSVVFAGFFLLSRHSYAIDGTTMVEGSASVSTMNSETAGGTSARMDTSASQSNTRNGLTAEVNSSRVLPTVNKITEESSQRLLPNVNKRTVEARVMVRGWDDARKQEIAEKIKAQVESDSQIDSVDISEDAVVMGYFTPAKLLGFIPWRMRLNVSADANARVKIKFPWYRFLIRSNFSNASDNINAVFQNNQTDLEFLTSRPSQEKQVEIFIKMSDAMHQMSMSIIGNIKA